MLILLMLTLMIFIRIKRVYNLLVNRIIVRYHNIMRL